MKSPRPLLSDAERTSWRERTAGQPGPQRDAMESIGYQRIADGGPIDGWHLSIFTTRGATVADLIDAGRPIERIVLRGDVYQITLPGDEYRMGGILGALRRHSNMSDEQRQAAGDRLRAARVAP